MLGVSNMPPNVITNISLWRHHKQVEHFDDVIKVIRLSQMGSEWASPPLLYDLLEE